MVIALAVTVVFHASLIVFGSFNGLTYIYPPPPEQSFVIDFSEDNEKQVVRQQKKGSAPQVEEPDRTKPIDKRALFTAANNKSDKDTLAPQTASKVTEALKEGHAQGNTKAGKTVGTPNAHVKGRSVVGVIAKPAYPVQKEGTVVVTIWVDNYGNVKKAQAGAPGTTTEDGSLWNAAREAALKTHFNMDADAPALQKGTITYIFKLTA